MRASLHERNFSSNELCLREKPDPAATSAMWRHNNKATISAANVQLPWITNCPDPRAWQINLSSLYMTQYHVFCYHNSSRISSCYHSLASITFLPNTWHVGIILVIWASTEMLIPKHIFCMYFPSISVSILGGLLALADYATTLCK